eukprot:UN05473
MELKMPFLSPRTQCGVRTEHGDKCKIICNQGYLSRSSHAICEKGDWIVDPCEPIACKPLLLGRGEKRFFNTVTDGCRDNQTMKEGEKCTIHCEEGYIGQKRIIKCVDGKLIDQERQEELPLEHSCEPWECPHTDDTAT